MSQIPRPPKQGNVMTYVAKVAAGYPHILAGEMDADLDTIYGAWNSGADTVNIRDGAITSAKLAADSVGPRELQDSGVGTANIADLAVTTPKLADGAVTDPKIASVAWAKVTGAPGAFAPSGPAGGDLSGSYPNPAIAAGAVTAAKLAPDAVSSASLAAGSVGAREIADGSVGTLELANLAVTRAKLAAGATNGSNVYTPIPVGQTYSGPLGWTTVAQLSITTRGGVVHLACSSSMNCSGPAVGGNVSVRWWVDGSRQATAVVYLCSNAPAYVPLPGLAWLDVPSAGGHTYYYQISLDANCYITTSAAGGGGILAQEVG
jgi:hypothetical protein